MTKVPTAQDNQKFENQKPDDKSPARAATDGDAGAISRRTWLGGAALVGAGAFCMMTTRAEAKMKPELAKYQAEPKGEAKCSGCSHFQAPNACQVVDGDISPEGWCQLFAKKS